MMVGVNGMQINIQLSDGAAAKLSYIRDVTNQDLAGILQSAIDVYYHQLQTPARKPLEIAQKFGFIGCIQAEPDLSKNYKSVVQSIIEQRHADSGNLNDHC